MSKLFRHIFLKKENTTQKRENNLNDICDMAKVRDLRGFYKTVTKKNSGKSDDKVPPFLSSASGSVNQAESFSTSEFFMNGFSSPHRFDRNCNGGGILLYVREDIPSKHLSLEIDLTEAFFVEINLYNKKKWLISCSYNQKRASIANQH